MNNELENVLEKLYIFLREKGFSFQSESIKRLLYYLSIDDFKKFKKEYKSSIIWGGAGSIKDIDLINLEQQEELDFYLKKLIELAKLI